MIHTSIMMAENDDIADIRSQIRAIVAGLRAEGRAVTAAAVAEALGVGRSHLYREAGGAVALQGLLREGEDAGPRLEERVAGAIRGLLSSRGLEAISVAEIAEGAGVSPITLYRRFGDRVGMLRVFLESLESRRGARTLDLVGAEDVEQALGRFCEVSLGELIRLRGIIAAGIGAESPSRAILRRLHAPESGTRAALAGALRGAMDSGRLPHQDPEAMAELLVSILMGRALLLPELHDNHAELLPAEGARIARHFLWGLRGRPGPGEDL